MKLNVDLSQLWRMVDRISKDRVIIDLTSPEQPFTPIEIPIDDDIPVILSEVQPETNGPLTYKGQHVLLFIPDHGDDIRKALEDTVNHGRRFHVAECQKLQEMRSKGRFERYVVTRRLKNQFKIYGTDAKHQPVSGTVELRVCRLCLNTLNYKNYRKLPPSKKGTAWESFDLAEFFKTYSIFFGQHPSRDADDVSSSGYTPDWDAVSRNVRAAAGYRCNECGINLTDHKNILHVHHINGVKQDNTPSNLRPLCADCHSHQPLHGYLRVNGNQMAVIESLRKQMKV